MPAASSAHAEGRVFIDVPFTIGGTTREDGHVAWGVRPELMIARRFPGIGVGPYLNGQRSTGDQLLATGATATYFTRGSWNVSPSAGVYHRWADRGPETGVEASLFVGTRAYEDINVFDFPMGVRVDYRNDFHARQEVVVSFQLDALIGVAAVLFSGIAVPHM